jgi:hypothetical protein
MDQVVIKRVLVQELNVTIMEHVLAVSKFIVVQNVKFVLVKMVELVTKIAVFVLLAFLENSVKFQNVIQKFPLTIKQWINVSVTKSMKVQIVDIVNARMVELVKEPNVNATDILKVNFVMSVNVRMEVSSTVKTACVQKIIMEHSVTNQNASTGEEFLKELIIIFVIA